MSTWSDVIDNPYALSDYDNVPKFEDVELVSIGLRSGFDCADIYLSSRELPQRGTRGWSEEMNAVSLSLELWGNLRVSLATAGPFRHPLEVQCNLAKHKGGVITLECLGPGVNLSIECQSARIAHFAGYVRSVDPSNEVNPHVD